mgnify:CR=1 FL=1
MEMHVMTLEILGQDERGRLLIAINGLNQLSIISYHERSRVIKFHDNNELSVFLHRNEKQFRKILHAKKEVILKPGFTLKFALCEKKDIDAFNDINNIIGLEKRSISSESFIVQSPVKNLPEIFTDGSFMKDKKRGGFAVIIKNTKGTYETYTFATNQSSSTLIELLAAIKGLEILANEKQLRIVTDSQYVRKGITEWIFYWKLNGWLTANGRQAKNIEFWKKFDRLTENKYIEFQWVKSHSGHFENTICDLYAKEKASGRF